MTLVAFFDKPLPVSSVGGKGSNLIALTQAGFNVPPGFIVTAQAYEAFIASLDWLDAQLAKFNYDRPDALRTQCQELRQRLSQVDLPEAISTAIRESLAQLRGRLGGDSANAAFAVRSSSTFEDLAEAAFAGQHDTYLNIRGDDAIIRSVRDCFISLWGDHSVAYRHHQGFSQRDARMAVVVQYQVECEVAGVGFSIHPVSGRLDQMVIDANYGLGESVVAGECEVDHFELDKKKCEIANQVIGHKDRMIAATPEGTTERTVPSDHSDVPCIGVEDLREVAQMLVRIEDHYGWPQDIEWGRMNGRLYLFQSRPVTTFQPRWTRDESAERFPNPMSPLSWDFISTAFRASLTHSLKLMGLPVIQGEWFSRIDQYIYGNQTAVELLALHRPLRARNAQELAAEIPQLRQRYSWVLDLPIRWARDLDRYLLRLGQLSAVQLDDKTLDEVWRHMNETLDAAADYFLPNIAISMTQTFLHRLLHGLVTMAVGAEKALPLVDGLLAGCETKTAVVNAELHELAQMARGNDALAKAFSQSGRELWEQNVLAEYPEFQARFQRFLEDHGHREVDMDYLQPTWASQPWIVLDSIGLILRGHEEEEPAETARKQRLRYSQTELAFLGSLPEEIRFFFRELIRLTRTYTTLDDLEHYQTTRLNPVARRAAIALGERLKDRSIVDVPADVFFARKDDLEAFVAEPTEERAHDLRQSIEAAKREYELAWKRTPDWSLEAKADVSADDDGGLRGLPGSPGCVTGPCYLVHTPDDFADFPSEAILVARTTNPAWTPLFYSASGLITESGGPLSHGAVTAREMRLPAVMSVRGAMSRFQNGQIVTVDGTSGLVRIQA